MQIKDSPSFKIQLGSSERPDLLSDIYFSHNPMHWRTNDKSSNEKNSKTYTINNQFTRINVRVDTKDDIKTYSGGVYGGVGNPAQQVFSAELAEQTFNRVSKQRAKWEKYSCNNQQPIDFNSDSPQQYINGLVNLRAPTDWVLTTQRADARSSIPKTSTLTAGQGGMRATLTKYFGVGENGEDVYSGILSGAKTSLLDAESAKKYFEQIQKRGDKAIELELRHIFEYELDSIFRQVPNESWIISNRWMDPSEDAQAIGYSATSSLELMEGKNSFELKIDVSIDTRYDEQVVRLILRRNGHQASRALQRSQHTPILDHLCSTFGLRSFHLESSEPMSRTPSRKVKDLVLS